MTRGGRCNPTLLVPYGRKEDTATSPRYRWNNWERGKHPYVIVQWTLSGEGGIDCERGSLRVPEGHALVAIVPERSSYYYPAENREPWVFSWLNFYGDLACDLFRKFQMEFGSVIPLPRKSAAAAALRRLISFSANSGETDRWQVSLQAYAFILEWWREVAEPARRGEEGLERAIRFCRERFREPLLVKEVANEAGMSREYFTRIFTARTKETPAAFLRRLRLDESSSLIRESRLPLEEIAMRSGFRSARHLTQTFQRVHGINPSQLRVQQKSETGHFTKAKF